MRRFGKGRCPLRSALGLLFGLVKAATLLAAGLVLACVRVLAHLVWRYL